MNLSRLLIVEPVKSNLSRVALAMLCAGGLLASAQAALKSAKVSDYKGDVTLSQGGATAQPVKINSAVTPSDVVRTGAKSLAELQFNDNTLTRLGANTIFSYSPKNREFQVESGTALLQVPPGLGGAKIQTAAVTAAITGTTVMVQKLPSGVVKLLVLEGTMNATLKGSNQMRSLKAGQMLIIPPNVNSLPLPIVVNVATIVGTSKLFQGFDAEIGSEDKIEETVADQKELTGNGGMKSGGVVITTVEDLIRLIGNNVLDSATFDSLTQNLAFQEGESHGHGFVNGPITVATGSKLTPTLNGVLGNLTLANGTVIPAADGGYPDATYFSLQGPLTFTGQLPEITADSTGYLAVSVLGEGLAPSDAAISFLNTTDFPTGGRFESVLFSAYNGSMVFNNADFTADNFYFGAYAGDIKITNGSTLQVVDGQTFFFAGNQLNIDGSGIEVVDLTGNSSVYLQSNNGMTINNSTIGGSTGIGNDVYLFGNGNINITNSLIGGSNVANVAVYATNGGNLSILNSSITGSTIVLGGALVNLTGTSVTGSSITIYTNGLTGGSFSTTPSIQPYNANFTP